MNRLGQLSTAVSILLTAPILPAITAAPAHAATCSGYGCDQQDPVNNGCNNGAYTVTSAPIVYNGTSYGTVDLRWSPTCQTNWARVTVNSNLTNKTRWADVLRQSPYATALWYTSAPGNPVYGNMLYAPGCAEAEAEIDLSNSAIAEGWAVQPGCPQF
jgi:hypothetical protein